MITVYGTAKKPAAPAPKIRAGTATKVYAGYRSPPTRNQVIQPPKLRPPSPHSSRWAMSFGARHFAARKPMPLTTRNRTLKTTISVMCSLMVLGVLVAVALFVSLRPAVGLVARPEKRTRGRVVLVVAVAGGLIAAYDGLVGPGTGTFLVLAFTSLVGADFLHGSAMAKLVNTGTNLGALVVFAATGHVLWLLGAAMAVCNIAGAVVGARMALRRGSGFVRVVLLLVGLALIAKLAVDQINA